MLFKECWEEKLLLPREEDSLLMEEARGCCNWEVKVGAAQERVWVAAQEDDCCDVVVAQLLLKKAKDLLLLWKKVLGRKGAATKREANKGVLVHCIEYMGRRKFLKKGATINESVAKKLHGMTKIFGYYGCYNVLLPVWNVEIVEHLVSSKEGSHFLKMYNGVHTWSLNSNGTSLWTHYEIMLPQVGRFVLFLMTDHNER